MESYSRRTGARLALAIAEPNTGDFLVKLRPDRARSPTRSLPSCGTGSTPSCPALQWEFPGILGDLIGDLMWSPSADRDQALLHRHALLKRKAPEIADRIEKMPGVVDIFDGLVYAGPDLSLRTRPRDARRFGLTADDIATAA